MLEQHPPEFEDRLRTLLARGAEAIPPDVDISARVRQTLMSPPHRRRLFGIVVPLNAPAIVAVLVVALLAATLTFVHPGGLPRPGGILGPGATPTTVLTTVPDFTDMQFAIAQSQALTAHLYLQETLQPNPTVAKGVIFAQNPAAGQQEPWGYVVTVTVSNGPAKQTMPDETGKQLNIAESDLASAGFTTVVPVFQLNSSVPAGVVFKTDPTAGSSITPDTAITLVRRHRTDADAGELMAAGA